MKLSSDCHHSTLRNGVLQPENQLVSKQFVDTKQILLIYNFSEHFLKPAGNLFYID